MIPSRHKARPSLRGAAAPTFADRAVIPRPRLSPSSAGFEILDDHGARPVRKARLATFLAAGAGGAPAPIAAPSARPRIART